MPTLGTRMASQCYSIGIRMVRNSWPVEVAKTAIIDPEIKGPNVTKITYMGSAIEQPFVQTGPKRWTSGETAYTEVNRDEYSVYGSQPNL